MTRYGTLALIAGAVSLAIGRVFGVIELFVIGAGFLGAFIMALARVLLRTPHVSGVRRVRPVTLVAGETGIVDLHLEHHGTIRSTRFDLHERVRRANVGDRMADLTVEPIAAGGTATASYHLPTASRGLIELGPLEAEVADPLGLLRRIRIVTGVDRVVVTPRAHSLEMPRLGTGPLGRHLLAQARRLGPGEFHSLREYVDGDEPRSIHWRASARGEAILVKQHAVEGLRRMLVVLDTDPASYANSASFERGVTVAASLVHSAAQADLVTRFVAGGVDLRGPDVAADALRVLAAIQLGAAHIPALDRQPGEGVGLLVAIAGSRSSGGVNQARNVIDPTQATVVVTTDETPRGAVNVSARTEGEFLDKWNSLVGRSGRVQAGRTS